MRRIFLLLVIGLALAALLSFAISLDPGYVVRISIGHWLIESNLWVMLALVAFIFCVLLATLSMLRGFRQSNSYIWRLLGQTGSKRAQQRTEKGLIALLEGDWKQANNLLARSANKANVPLINYLSAAYAANELGEIKDAEQYLKKAYENTSDSEFAVGIAQAKIQLQQNQLEQGLATLLRLNKQHANHPFVLKLLKKVYLKLEDWQQLLNILPAVKKSVKGHDEYLLSLEKQAWGKLFIQKTEELQHQNRRHSSADIFASLWKKVPDALRFDPTLIEIYAKQLIQLKNDDECEILLRKALNKHWDERLVLLYGMVRGKNVSEQLIYAENWLKQKPNSATLLLSLGRLSLSNELWGKASEYFEASNRIQPDKRCYAELCRLNMRLHKNDQTSLNSLIDSLALPDLPLPK